MSGMFYSVVGNLRKPNLYKIGGVQNEGTYRGKKGRHVTQNTAEGNTSYELSWKVQVAMKKIQNIINK